MSASRQSSPARPRRDEAKVVTSATTSPALNNRFTTPTQLSRSATPTRSDQKLQVQTNISVNSKPPQSPSRSSSPLTTRGTNGSSLKNVPVSPTIHNRPSSAYSSHQIKLHAATEIWTPPATLQRCDTKSRSNGTSSLYFPLELSTQDYMARILKIIAWGVSQTVTEISEKYSNPGGLLNVLDTCVRSDTLHLMNQILGKRHASNLANVQLVRQLFAGELTIYSCMCFVDHFNDGTFKLFITHPSMFLVVHIVDELHTSRDKLVASCEVILQTRLELFQPCANGLEGNGRLDDLGFLFSAARELLECFGPAAASAIILVNR